jgi:hypothetical protein
LIIFLDAFADLLQFFYLYAKERLFDSMLEQNLLAALSTKRPQ